MFIKTKVLLINVQTLLLCRSEVKSEMCRKNKGTANKYTNIFAMLKSSKKCDVQKK